MFAILICAEFCFNPRTHTGCDLISKLKSVSLFLVSIHAPTRGATASVGLVLTLEDVSIHAPTRGATTINQLVVLSNIVSIHAPTRGATRAKSAFHRRVYVSIHAPTRGATPVPRHCSRPNACFNPRTHTGCDVMLFILPNSLFCFNPRTHTGCDAALSKTTTATACFNPRTHTGCDQAKQEALALLTKFQSTHPHGVRRLPCVGQ